MRDLREALTLDPGHAYAWASLGATRLALGAPAAALIALDRALELEPDYTWALIRRARVWRELGEPGRRLADLDRAVALQPDSPWAHCERGDALRTAGRDEEALVAYDLALTLEPGPGLGGEGACLERAYRIDYLALLPKRHPLARKASLRLVDLVACPLVVGHGGTYSRQLLEQALHHEGLSDCVQIVAETDTSAFTVHELRDRLRDLIEGRSGEHAMTVTLVSFGFKYGLPTDLDLAFDCRFLPNPFFVEALRPRSGTDAAVADYVLASEGAAEFLDHMVGLLRFTLPRYQREGKSYLTIAIGCTGGKHRSVYIAEALKRELSDLKSASIRVSHRDMARAR